MEGGFLFLQTLPLVGGVPDSSRGRVFILKNQKPTGLLATSPTRGGVINALHSCKKNAKILSSYGSFRSAHGGEKSFLYIIF